MASLTFRDAVAAEQTSVASLLARTSTPKDTAVKVVGEEEGVVRAHPFQGNEQVCSFHLQSPVEVMARRKALPSLMAGVGDREVVISQVWKLGFGNLYSRVSKIRIENFLSFSSCSCYRIQSIRRYNHRHHSQDCWKNSLETELEVVFAWLWEHPCHTDQVLNILALEEARVDYPLKLDTAGAGAQVLM